MSEPLTPMNCDPVDSTTVAEKQKRIGIPKMLRFEVFKRDGFCCQYCGAHPPSVKLHVDHIVPVAFGGTNDIDNLVTACEPCNLGKGARSLSVVPQSLAEKAIEVAEREEQLRGYSAVLEAKRQRLEDDTWRVLDVMYPSMNSVQRCDFSSVKVFIEKLGVHAVLESAEIAVSSSVPFKRMFSYFCGVCWNKVRESKK